eukprot:PhM_4_TR11968/c0_g1_i1/m.31008
MKTTTLLLALLVVICVAAAVHVTTAAFPDAIPLRYRGGDLYHEALLRHGTLSSRTYQNTTVNIFQQLIDHANPKRGTFEQRFWYDTTYWKPGTGPVFLYISGEGPASGSPSGFITNVAANASALLITLEHRYYGESLPMPLTDKDTLMSTLNVDTVMADFRAFMEYFESTIVRQKVRWVAVGGSYAGALSAWLKVTFPERFVASWSSSGVVEAQFDFTAYDGHIVSVLPDNCTAAIRNVMGNFSVMWDDINQRSALRALFGTPSSATKEDMAWMLSDAISGGVQYGAKFQMCAQLVPQRSDLMAQYAEYINKTFGPSFASSCTYSTACLSDPKNADQWAAAGYPWIWQSCSELGYWQVAYPGSLRSPLVTTSYFINQCRAMFTPTVFSDTFGFNQRYGGKTPNATHVIALQGSDDPFSEAGVQKSLGPLYLEHTAECDTCGHCGDLRSVSPDDPENLTKQREFIMTTLMGWLNQ